MPCYNEQDTIKDVLRDCFKKFPKAEVIVVNDRSTDNSLKILKQFKKKYKGLKIVTNKVNSGHATSVIRGLWMAQGDYVIYIDSDYQIRFSDFFWDIGVGHFSLMSGYRINRQDKLFRKVISFILKITILLRHGMLINDANCPFKIFKKEELENYLLCLPYNSIVPSICLEIIARKWDRQNSIKKVVQIPMLHRPYIKERKGTLQSLNRKSLSMFLKAFKEVWTI